MLKGFSSMFPNNFLIYGKSFTTFSFPNKSMAAIQVFENAFKINVNIL